VDEETFCRCLLLALATKRRSMLASGESFHSAFRSMLQLALGQPSVSLLAEKMLEDFDPVFSVSPAADAMVLRGLRDRILAMRLGSETRVEFLVGPAQAGQELRRATPFAGVFKLLAKHLLGQMKLDSEEPRG